MSWSETLRTPWVASAAIIVVILGAVIGWKLLNPDPPAPPEVQPAALTTVQLLKTLADEANNTLKQPTAVVRAPMFGAQAIGTLTSSDDLGVSRRCHPLEDPATLQPTGFPPQSYNLTRAAAGRLTAGLLGGASAAVELGRTSEIVLTFDDVVARVVYADEVADMLKASACRAAITGANLKIVVGYIQAKRTFRLTGAVVNNAKLTMASSSFEVTPGTDSQTIEIKDRIALPLFEIVSDLPKGADAVLAKPALTVAFAVGGKEENGKVVLPTTPPTQQSSGRIYLQRDKADASGKDKMIVAGLIAAGLPAERQVERMPSGRTPRQSSVRYYNEDDHARALQVAAIVGKFYPGVTVSRLRFVAPAGQMEVWLPQKAPPAAGQADPAEQ